MHRQNIVTIEDRKRAARIRRGEEKPQSSANKVISEERLTDEALTNVLAKLQKRNIRLSFIFLHIAIRTLHPKYNLLRKYA